MTTVALSTLPLLAFTQVILADIAPVLRNATASTPRPYFIWRMLGLTGDSVMGSRLPGEQIELQAHADTAEGAYAMIDDALERFNREGRLSELTARYDDEFAYGLRSGVAVHTAVIEAV